MKLKILQKNSRVLDIILSVLVIISGITVNTPIWHFKYIYMLSTLGIVFLSCVCIDNKSGGIQFLKKNALFVCFVVYLAVIVFGKKVVQYNNGTMLSVMTGFGDPVYALFGLAFWGLCSKEKTKLFMMSYVGAFTLIFLFTGHYTLFDFGRICRTISLYENPNILAFYASVSFFFAGSLSLNSSNKVLRYVFALCAAIALGAVYNTSSRAMYLGLTAGVVLSLLLFVWNVFVVKKISLRVCLEWIPAVAVVLAITLITINIYAPNPANALINASGEDITQFIQNEELSESVEPVTTEPVMTEPVMTEPVMTEPVMTEPTYISGADRVEADTHASSAAKTNIRFEIWKEYLGQVSADTFFGNEPGADSIYFKEYWRDYAPHNMIIYVLFAHGVPGVVMFIAMYLQFVFAFFSKRYFTRSYTILLAGVFAISIYGMFHDIVDIPIFWCIFGALYNYSDAENTLSDTQFLHGKKDAE